MKNTDRNTLEEMSEQKNKDKWMKELDEEKYANYMHHEVQHRLLVHLA